MNQMMLYLYCVLWLNLMALMTVKASLFAGFTVGRQFQYIGKFCFGWDPDMSKIIGTVSGRIQTLSEGLQVVLYDDQDGFWNVISNSSCGCECKISPQHTKYLANVTESFFGGPNFEFSINIHEHLRPRFWYVALAKCVPGGDSYKPRLGHISDQQFVKYFFTSWYEIEFTQADGSQVPVYQQGLSTVYGVMSVLSLCLCLLQSYSANLMRNLESFHSIIKLLTFITTAFFASTVFFSIHYFIFTVDGVGVPLFYAIAKIIRAFIRVATILLAMAVAKGWTITSVVLHGREELIYLTSTLLFFYVSLAFWYLLILDPASTLYLYDSWPGFFICVLHLIVLVWFNLTILKTKRSGGTSSKKSFFTQMTVIFSVYLIALPIIVIIASFLSPWVREKIVNSVVLWVEFLVYCFLVFILWPTRAPHNFERLYTVASQNERISLTQKYSEVIPTEEL